MIVFAAALLWFAPNLVAQATAPSAGHSQVALLAPPPDEHPITVLARFEFGDIQELNDGAETFQFQGVLTLTWKDSRQAYDPATAGVNEKVFQGGYQFNEVSTGWYPQVVLVNESGLNDRNGVVLRVLPDGTSTLLETINGCAEVQLDLTRFPFDKHQLQLEFQVLGFGQDEVVLRAAETTPAAILGAAAIPAWNLHDARSFVESRSASGTQSRLQASTFVVAVNAIRNPFFMLRLVIIPLGMIVLLSFAVFWMERSSLGDRISVSFIGILTAVAYQMAVSGSLPAVDYPTHMHFFLSFSFLTMCATVVINLVVGAVDKRGKHTLGDKIDKKCRWVFPTVYFGVLLLGSIAIQLR